jgi:UDPglucose 6-dehydrogenase
VCILGLAFKSNTDDTRESPALAVIRRLVVHPIEVVAYDRLASPTLVEGATRAQSLQEALRGADVVAILTEWPEFADLQPDELAKKMAGRTIVDTRYVLDPDYFRSAGFEVISLGR